MRILTFLAIALFAFGLTALDVEARRMGGGGSIGKQRQSLNLNRQQQAAPQAPQSGKAASPASQAAPAAGAASGSALWPDWLQEGYWHLCSWAALLTGST